MRVESSPTSPIQSLVSCSPDFVARCVVPVPSTPWSSDSSRTQPAGHVLSDVTAIPAVTPTITDLLPHLTRLLTVKDDGERPNGIRWSRPRSCPAVQGLPAYAVAPLDAAVHALRGIHLRYHSWSDRAFLNLPLHNTTLLGTPYTVGQTLTAMLYLPQEHTVIDAGSHNLQRVSHSSGRCNLVLNAFATEALKHGHNLDRTRLIDDPNLLAILRPGTAYHEPPNLWKPLKQTEMYVQHGLLEETLHHLGYSEIVFHDVAFHGSGTSRPDGIVHAKKAPNGDKRVYEIIIEGKACRQVGSTRYAIEAVMQVLFHKFLDYEHQYAEEAVVTIPCQLNKPTWSTIAEQLANPDGIQYSRHVRRMVSELSKVQSDKMQVWYEQKVHFHDRRQLRELASNRPSQDRNAINTLIDLICWDTAKSGKGAETND
jgi:hypothetical protein